MADDNEIQKFVALIEGDPMRRVSRYDLATPWAASNVSIEFTSPEYLQRADHKNNRPISAPQLHKVNTRRDVTKSEKNHLRRNQPKVTPSDIRREQDRIKKFLTERTRLHETYIKEKERTRRIGMIIAAALLALACVLPLLTSEGRETLSYIISAALFVAAAGAFGFTHVSINNKDAEISASSRASDK